MTHDTFDLKLISGLTEYFSTLFSSLSLEVPVTSFTRPGLPLSSLRSAVAEKGVNGPKSPPVDQRKSILLSKFLS